MHRKPSHYFRKSFAAVLAAAAGLVVGTQVPTGHEATSSDTTQYFVMQAYASDAFVPFVTGSVPLVADDRNRPDPARECASGIDLDCIYQ